MPSDFSTRRTSASCESGGPNPGPLCIWCAKKMVSASERQLQDIERGEICSVHIHTACYSGVRWVLQVDPATPVAPTLITLPRKIYVFMGNHVFDHRHSCGNFRFYGHCRHCNPYRVDPVCRRPHLDDRLCAFGPSSAGVTPTAHFSKTRGAFARREFGGALGGSRPASISARVRTPLLALATRSSEPTARGRS